MKVRIKFSKQGPVKFIGHLDVMRYFQKAMRRAGIDIKYSEGFSPHQIMSFAAPLGLGLTSNGEYMDIEVNSMNSCETMVKQLNAVMVEGIEVLEMDLKPAIYELTTEGDHIFMKVSAGSQDNLKPELIMETYDRWRGESCPEFAFLIQREEVYGNTGDEEHRNLVPLGLIGEEVE